MMSQYDLQQTAIEQRNAELMARREAFEHTVTEYTALMVAEYEHNTGVRGVSAYGALREARDVAGTTFAAIQDRVEQGLEERYMADRDR